MPVKKQQHALEEDEEYANETEAERRARLEKLVQEGDLENALSLFGLEGAARSGAAGSAGTKPIIKTITSPFDTMSPSTMVEFDQFQELIVRRLGSLEGAKNYPTFLHNLIMALMTKREVQEVRKVATAMAELVSAKMKEKQKATAKPVLAGAKKGADRYDGSAFADEFDD